MPPHQIHTLRSLACLGALVGALASAPAAAQDPSAPVFSHDQLARTYSTAATLAAGVECPTTTPPQPDLEAARTLAQAAAMFDVAARNYPPPAPKVDPSVHAQKLAELILQATQVYEQAYRCAPGFEQRHHLENARALVDMRLIVIREVEKRPDDARDVQLLAARRSELDKLIPQAPQPKLVDPDPPPRPRQPPPPEPPSGYVRYAGFLVLRPEIGLGTGKLLADAPSNPYVTHNPNFTSPFVQLFVAARFSGARRPHAFMLGGTFNYQRISRSTHLNGENAKAVLATALRLEAALHAHPRWFSFHPLLELGMQVGLGDVKWGHPYVGPGLGLCLDRELACITVKFTTPLASPERSEPSVQLWQVGLGIDLMRIVDRAKGLATP